MMTNVYGGMAAGYTSTYYATGHTGDAKWAWTSAHTQSWDPTIGIRFRF